MSFKVRGSAALLVATDGANAPAQAPATSLQGLLGRLPFASLGLGTAAAAPPPVKERCAACDGAFLGSPFHTALHAG